MCSINRDSVGQLQKILFYVHIDLLDYLLSLSTIDRTVIKSFLNSYSGRNLPCKNHVVSKTSFESPGNISACKAARVLFFKRFSEVCMHLNTAKKLKTILL